MPSKTKIKKRRPKKPPNPLAKTLPRLGHGVKPSARTYRRPQQDKPQAEDF